MSLFEHYYAQHVEIGKIKDNGECSVLCPFHDDSDPSLSINLRSGLYNCFGCNQSGNVYKFHQAINKTTYQEAKVQVDTFFESVQDEDGPFIDAKQVSEWHRSLLASPELLRYLLNDRGLAREVVNEYKIGWNGQRYTIPIKNREGNYVNIRQYSKDGKGTAKMISYGEGYGRTRLYPQNVLDNARVVVCEGEWDCLCAISRGIPAVTVTNGADSWNSLFNYRFMGKEVYICYDIDNAGKSGARKVAEELSSVATVHIVDLPLNEPSNADVSNYFVDAGYTADTFKELLSTSPVYKTQGKNDDADEEENIIETNLDEGRHANYRDQLLSLSVRVSGKETAPYDIPRSATLYCGDAGSIEKLCQFCAINNKGTPDTALGKSIEWQLSNKTVDHNPLELIKVSNDKQQGLLKKWNGVPITCPIGRVRTTSFVNLEEVQIVPEEQYSLLNAADKDTNNNDSKDVDNPVSQRAYFLGKDLRSNTPYQVIARRTVVPDTQSATFLITEAKIEGTDLTSFRQTSELIETLKIFQPSKGRSVLQQMDYISSDLTNNVTRVFGRENIVTGMDFVYHTVRAFYFDNSYQHKGWGEALFVGDTRSGKSQIGRSLIQHYRLGEMVSGENASYAGIVGGLEKEASGRWFANWGKLVLNDGKLVFLDEAQGLSYNIIDAMSSVRSEGIATIDKIHKERVRARTRTIWSSNPRGKIATTTGSETRPMKSYPYGVTCLPELIGKAEDIARFDFVVGLAEDDVPKSLPNLPSYMRPYVEHEFTSDLCHILLLWGWSRRADQIIFDREAEQLILQKAEEQGEKYSPKIPLVQSQSQRFKIARLAASAAVRTFSTDSTGENVIIRKEHVEAACEFIDREYSRPFFNYAHYSLIDHERDLRAKKMSDKVKAILHARTKLTHALLQYDVIKPADLALQMGEDMATTRGTFGFLHACGMLIQDGAFYRKSPIFVDLIRDVVDDMGEYEIEVPKELEIKK